MKKIIFIFMMVAILILSKNINAALYPVNGSLQDQQKWIFENPNDINFNDASQRNAFLKAYESNGINLNSDKHRQLVEKYLIGYTGSSGIPSSDRKLFSNYVSSVSGIATDLSKGQGIRLTKNQAGTLLLISGDNQEHNINSLALFKFGAKKLEKILSKDDGTIELVQGQNSINLKGITLQRDKFGNFVLSDGTQITFNENFGKITLSDRISCNSATCSFSIGQLKINLNNGGSFENLGNNRYSIIDGKIETEDAVLVGSYEFSTDSKKVGINFNKNINLRAFLKEGKTINSLIQSNSKEYGQIEISTNSLDKTLSNVIACFDCTDFIKHVEQYGGYVDLKKSELCYADLASCENLFSSEIRGKVGAKFQNDVSHTGFDENLLLTYDSSPSQAKISLISCNGCKDGAVSSQILNGKKFNIFNDVDKGKQSFIVTEDSFVFRESGDYSRQVFLIDNPGEVKNTYLIEDDGSVTIDKVTQQDIDDYKNYQILNSKRAEKGLNILEKLNEEDQKVFLAFFEEMSDGRDGEIIRIGKIRRDGTVARIGESFVGEKFYALGSGNYMAIRDQNTQKLLDEGKIDLNDLSDLGDANKRVAEYESIKVVKTILVAFSPQTPEELAMALALGGSGRVELALKNAGSELRALRAAASLGAEGPAAMMAGKTASKELATISKLDAFSSFRVSKADDFAKLEGVTQQGREAFINDFKDKLAATLKERRTDLSPDEFSVRGLRGEVIGGKEVIKPQNLVGDNQDLMVFLDKNNNPLFMASIYATKEEAQAAVDALTALEKLGVGRGYRYKAGFKVDYDPGVGKEGYVVVRELPADTLGVKPETIFEQFQKKIDSLAGEDKSKAEAAKAAYEKCCRLDVSNAKLDPSIKDPMITSGTTTSQSATLPEVRVEIPRVGPPQIIDVKTGKLVGEFGYSIEGDTLKIGYVKVYEPRNGYNNAALLQILKENPGITRIETRLTQVNQELFTKALIQKVHPGTTLDNRPINIQFGDCCADDVLRASKEERDVLVKDALKETPAYKTRVKSGFKDICGQNLKVQKTNPENPIDISVFIDFAACK